MHPIQGYFGAFLALNGRNWAFNQCTPYGVLLSALSLGERLLPFDQCTPYGVLQVLMGMTLDSHYLQPMPPYGVLLLGKGRGILLPRAFNQRILYRVLLLATLFWGLAIFLQPTHPIRGCFQFFVKFVCRILPSTNAPHTGVLRAMWSIWTWRAALQPTHPVFGASN